MENTSSLQSDPTTITSMSVEEVNANNVELGWDIQYRQLKPSPYEGFLKVRECAGVALGVERVNANVEISGNSSDEQVSILIPWARAESGIVAHGERLKNTAIYSLDVGSELYASVPDQSIVCQAYIARESFLSEYEDLFQDIAPFERVKHLASQMKPEALYNLQLRIKNLVANQELDDLQQAEQMQGMLECIFRSLYSSFASSGNTSIAQMARVRKLSRSREYIEESLHTNIRVSDICREVGVSLSTLERLYRENYGLGPKQYLRGRRLHRVHETLKRSDPLHTRVESVAQQFGVSHLGRFSGEYAQMFGESPKKTLGYIQAVKKQRL